MKNTTFGERYPVAFIIALIDVMVVVVAAYMAYYIRFGNFHWPIYYGVVIIITALLLVINSIFSGIYHSWRGLSVSKQLVKLVGCWVMAFAVLMVLLVFFKQNYLFSRIWMGGWLVLGILISCLYKGILFWFLKTLRKKGHNIKSVAVIGRGKALNKIMDKSSQHAEYGFNVVKFIDLPEFENGSGSLDKELQQSSLETAHEIWICLSLKDGDLLKQILYQLRYSTAEIRYFPRFEDIRLLNHKVTNILGMYALDLSCTPMDGVSHFIKRLEDLVLGSLIAVLVLPICGVIAIAVKLSSPGPVLFKQYRNGIGGKRIKMYKFRTMRVHQEENGCVAQAKMNDPRLTKIGAYLRKTSLDELPQFYNVLQGRMSIVGPRPHALAHNEYYKDLVESYMWRHKVKSGITGWAQVNGYRGETEILEKMKKRVQYDLWYIENWSFWLDLKIILLTVFKGFANKNAY